MRLSFVFIAANLLIGLLLAPNLIKAESTISRHAEENSLWRGGAFTSGTSALISEANPQGLTDTENTPSKEGNSYSISAPEVTSNSDANENIAQDGYSRTYQPETRHESELAPSSPAYNSEELPGRLEYQEIVRYVDREVVKEVLIEKSQELREFNSLKELDTWLAEDDTNEYVYLFAGKDGVCRLSDRYDCDDYAFQLQKQAARSGFLLSVTIIEERGKPHMINLAGIRNDIYYIEPQSDKVWFYCNRD